MIISTMTSSNLLNPRVVLFVGCSISGGQNGLVLSLSEISRQVRRSQNNRPGKRIPREATAPITSWARKAFLRFSGVHGEGGLPQSSSFGSCSLKSFSINDWVLNQAISKIKEIKEP